MKASGIIVYDFYSSANYEIYDMMFLYYAGSKPYSSLEATHIILTSSIGNKDVLAGALNREEDNNMVEVTE
jgi:hypothetical protein